MKDNQKNSKDKLLEKIDIVTFISEYVDLRKSGSGYIGYSPFKEENTPSFSVAPNKNIFKDFSTGIGGDVIKFYSLMEKIGYKEALIELSKRYNVKLDNVVYKIDENEKSYLELSKVNEHFQKNLKNSTKALKYLESRAYTNEDIENFGLGYATDTYNDLYNKFDNEILEELGLIKFNKQYYDTFVNRITFPIYNINRKIVGFGARDISNDEKSAKYLNSKETKIFVKGNEVFGLFDGGVKIREYNSCILVEGFFDVLRLHQNNIKNTIASLGTALTEKQAFLISKMTKNIVIAYDDDNAGKEAKIRSINILNKYGFNIKIMNLENLAKDPDEFIFKYGKDKFIELLNKSIDAFDFLYIHYSKSYDMTKIASKISVINDLKDYFSSFSSAIHFENNLKKLSARLEINYDVLEKEIIFKNINAEKISTKKKINSENEEQKLSKSKQLEELTIYLLYRRQEERKKYTNFIFAGEYSDILEKLVKSDFNENNLDKEDYETLGHIITKYEDKYTKEDYRNKIYSKWVEAYIKDSLNYIMIYTGGNLSKMPSDMYVKYIEYINKLKKINIINREETEKLFSEYLEYEGRNLHVLSNK
ncbi:DNA primase [Oceanivirga salmonicida]|uniref:DNA primase n=1 Tax=Oceanivirga salmonicida TaxID=1769291 RepID=UPI0012E2C8E5|nr:DNA primase [Oceanivirga salmonicida]